MILTLIAAAVLGIGRLLLGGVAIESDSRGWLKMSLGLSLLLAANTLTTLPMLAAALLPSWTKIACAVAVIFSLFITVLEASLFGLVSLGKPPTIQEMITVFALINLIQCGWVLAIVATLRAGGYRLISAPR